MYPFFLPPPKKKSEFFDSRDFQYKLDQMGSNALIGIFFCNFLYEVVFDTVY